MTCIWTVGFGETGQIQVITNRDTVAVSINGYYRQQHNVLSCFYSLTFIAVVSSLQCVPQVTPPSQCPFQSPVLLMTNFKTNTCDVARYEGSCKPSMKSRVQIPPCLLFTVVHYGINLSSSSSSVIVGQIKQQFQCSILSFVVSTQKQQNFFFIRRPIESKGRHKNRHRVNT